MKYEEKIFKDAMKSILFKADELSYIPRYKPKINSKNVNIVFPHKNSNYKRVCAYLIKTRKIHQSIVEEFIKYNKLYEDERHNCVFVGYKNNNAVYGLKIGTNTNNKFKRELAGSNKDFSVELRNNYKSDTVCIFESIIDAMSYETFEIMNGLDINKKNKISLAGVSDKKLKQYLNDNNNIKRIICCLDNDKAGIEATEQIKQKYSQLGYKISIEYSEAKDWNEDLVKFIVGNS